MIDYWVDAALRLLFIGIFLLLVPALLLWELAQTLRRRYVRN